VLLAFNCRGLAAENQLLPGREYLTHFSTLGVTF